MDQSQRPSRTRSIWCRWYSERWSLSGITICRAARSNRSTFRSTSAVSAGSLATGSPCRPVRNAIAAWIVGISASSASPIANRSADASSSAASVSFGFAAPRSRLPTARHDFRHSRRLAVLPQMRQVEMKPSGVLLWALAVFKYSQALQFPGI